MSNQDTDSTTANDDQAPALDCPALRTVCEILETLEDLRVLFGMQYDADQGQIDGRRHIFVNVWETQSEHNTHLSPDCENWQPGMIEPVISSTSRTINGERVPAYGWVEYDDNDQNNLHRLLGALLILRGDQVCDTYLPF